MNVFKCAQGNKVLAVGSMAQMVAFITIYPDGSSTVFRHYDGVSSELA